MTSCRPSTTPWERGVELDDVNEFLDAVLTSVKSGIVIVDMEMRVRVWNRRADDLWGLRRDEAVGQHLLNLDIGLPVADLRPTIRAALQDVHFEEITVMEAVNRR